MEPMPLNSAHWRYTFYMRKGKIVHLKIIGVVGMLDNPHVGARLWQFMGEAFLHEFPDATFTTEHLFYFPWQKSKIQRLAEKILDKHDTGEELILLGHSLGGIIACAIAPKFKHSKVKCVVTVSSPHKLHFLYRFLDAEPTQLPFPVITFADTFDTVVPSFLSRYPGSIHGSLLADHLFWFLFSKRPSTIIAKKVRALVPK